MLMAKKSKVEVEKLDGNKIDKFNACLSMSMKECKNGNKVNSEELKNLLSDVDDSLFDDELNQLTGLSDEQQESLLILEEVDKSCTEKVGNRGRC